MYSLPDRNVAMQLLQSKSKSSGSQQMLTRRILAAASRVKLKSSFPKLALAILLVIVPAVIVVSRPLFHANAAKPSGPLHVLSIPYYSIKGDWDSRLTLNNSAHEALTASLTLYSLDGKALPLPDVSLQPSGTVLLRLRELVALSPHNEPFQEGSVELRFNHADGMALAPQLTVADAPHKLSFDMEPPMGFKSSNLESLWWSPDEQTSGQLMLSNTTATTLTVKPSVEWRGVVIPTPAISLSAHQTVVLDIEKLLKNRDLSAKGIESGGLSIAHNGAPGALIAHGVIFNQERGFASNLNVVDPAAQKTAVLDGTGLLLGRPATDSLVSQATFFTPRLTLKNASKSAQTATVTVRYTANGRLESKTLPVISLAPHEVRMVDFSHLVAGLRHVAVASASLEVASSGAPGSMIAALTSLDEAQSKVVDVPLVSRSERSGEGGNHPFRLDDEAQSVAYLTNITDKPTTVMFAVFYEGGMFTPDLIRVAAGETRTINLLELRNQQVKDVQGRTLPKDLRQGQFFWHPHQGEALIGRVVMLDQQSGTASSFGCPLCCQLEPSYFTFSPSPFDGPVGGFQQMNVYEYDSYCGQFTLGPYTASGIQGFTSDSTAIATVNSTGMVNFMSVGDTMVRVAIQYYHSDYISAEDCGQFLANTEADCPVAVRPHLDSISPARGVQGVAYSLTITGMGFKNPATVNVAGTGITVSGTQVGSSTEIITTFTIASNAPGGNHAVTVTVSGQTSDNSVNFFVQIPSKVVFFDDPPNAPQGMGPLTVLTDGDVKDLNGNVRLTHQCGVYRNIEYQLVDQDNPPQGINTGFALTESFTDYQGPDSTPSDLARNISDGNEGVFGDIQYFGRTAPSCLGTNDHETMHQHFSVKINNQTFPISTVVNISRGRFSGNYQVDVSILTQ